MINKLLLAVLGLVLLSLSLETSFLADQKKYERVRTAIKEKQEYLSKKLEQSQVTLENINMLIVAYKDDDLLDVFI